MKTYRTAEIAAAVGVHPNTIRFYEQQGLLPPIPREKNGYRLYSERHLLQLRLIRLAFRAEILSGSLRAEVLGIVRDAAAGAPKAAKEKTMLYRAHLRQEMQAARRAAALAESWLDGQAAAQAGPTIGRRAAADEAGVSIDVLRDWERNGLLTVPRRGNRRQYGAAQRDRIRIIALLRRANYSQTSIRRMLEALDGGGGDLLCALDTPAPTEDIVSVADRYITSLSAALRDAGELLRLLEKME